MKPKQQRDAVRKYYHSHRKGNPLKQPKKPAIEPNSPQKRKMGTPPSSTSRQSPVVQAKSTTSEPFQIENPRSPLVAFISL